MQRVKTKTNTMIYVLGIWRNLRPLLQSTASQSNSVSPKRGALANSEGRDELPPKA